MLDRRAYRRSKRHWLSKTALRQSCQLGAIGQLCWSASATAINFRHREALTASWSDSGFACSGAINQIVDKHVGRDGKAC
jgi:hypothetical protein